MANIVSRFDFVESKRWIYSSSLTKTAILDFKGRSASFFRISTDYCINPCSYL